ncbi:MAG: hypothetical protein OEW29_12745 [Acidimicrobiia bacterium]|nr:hypothetical protein [Acidimicrobiia bacterium]
MTTSQFDFSNDEWELVATVPVLVGMAVARAEDSGFLGSFKETRALMGAIAAQAELRPAGSLIAQAATTDTGERFEEYREADSQTLAADAVDACRQLADVLSAVAQPDEADGYKRWVLDVARAVAGAAKEHGVRVSAGEEAVIARVESALGLSSV